jgi:ribosomal-protein-alanine N-acetyltransferase
METDREAFVALRRASAGSLGPWEPRTGDREQQFGDQFFDRLLGRRESESDEPFLIHRASDDEIVGYVGLGQIFRGPFRSCIMGYWIGDPYLGRGYGTSGVRACLEMALVPEVAGGLGLHRVEANIIPSNHASLALVRRLGMRKEGYSPRYLEIGGEWRDHERWAITVEDWKMQRHPNS